MIATNTVKINGIIYRAGDELPALDSINNKAKITKPIEKAIDKAIEEVIEPTEMPKTKTEINRLSTAKLQELAKELGIADAEEMSGSQLKKIIPDKLGI